jgi:type IV pilus assembly protein PilM
MWKRLFSSNKARWQLGLHVLPYAMRLTDVRRKGSLYIRKHETIPLQNGLVENGRVRDKEWVAFELQKKVQEWNCKGREVVLSVPLSTVVIRWLQIPRVPDKEIRDLVDIEIENTLHLPFSHPVFDYVKLSPEHAHLPGLSTLKASGDEGPPEEKLNLLVVAAPEAAVQSFVDVARAAGLKPVAADVEPLAIYRTLEVEWPAVAGAGTMLLNINLSGVDVAVFSGGIPEFIRHIPLSVPFFDETDVTTSLALAKHAVSHLEREGTYGGYLHDLYAEVNRIMNFYQYSMYEGRQKVEQICLTGDFCDLASLAGHLQERLLAPVYTPGYEHLLAVGDDFAGPAFAVAVGLGLKDVSGL